MLAKLFLARRMSVLVSYADAFAKNPEAIPLRPLALIILKGLARR